MKNFRFFLTALALGMLPVNTVEAAATLTLGDFLQQVTGKNQAYIASKAAEQAAANKSSDADIMYAPTLFGQVQSMVDEKPAANPAMSGDKTQAEGATIGVSKLFSSGTSIKASYTAQHTEISNASPTAFPQPDFYEAHPTLEINQPLWRNGLGKETKATAEVANLQAEVQQHTEAYKQRMTLAQAESTYWRLALARENVAMQKDSLSRAMKIRQWNQERVRLSLGDKADLYQADTAVKGRELEVLGAEDELQAAMRAFNTARGVSGDVVAENLQKIDQNLLASLKVPSTPKTRPDVEAARKSAKMAAAAATLTDQKYKPSVDLFGTFSFNGRDKEMSEATSDSFKPDTPTTIVGLKFSMPLSSDLVRRSREGGALSASAAENAAQRQEFEMQRDWQDLTARFDDAQKHLKLTTTFEKVQAEKVEYERQRLRRGRTTTYQVLAFEQDYANSQLNRIRAEANILGLIAQMKTFGGEAQ